MRPIKVLALTRYGRLAASSRYRLLQFMPVLAEAGIEVTVRPLLGDWYVQSLVEGRQPSRLRIIAAYLSRISLLLRDRTPDVVWIERELLPWMPWVLDKALLGRRFPTILDLDDSVFHRYDQHESALVRRLLGRRIDRGMAAASVVTCGNPTIADRARASGARRTIALPTVVDLARYPATPPDRAPDDRFTIGWIGSPQNSPYLEALRMPLTELASEGPVRILVIGGQPDVLAGLPVERRSWSEATEIADLSDMDVGIMPLPDRPFERGKCGLKILQYLAAWKPAIASPVGVNTHLIGANERGFLADRPEEWLAALRRLRDDADLRRTLGQAGRRMVEQNYSIESAAPRLVALIEELGAKRQA